MPQIKQRQKRTKIILLSLLAAVIVAGTLYLLYARRPVSDQAITQNAPGWEQPSRLTEQPLAEKQPLAPEAETEEQPAAPAPPGTPPMKTAAESSCQETSARVSDFFSYLDQRTYVAFYEFKGGSKQHFAGLIKKLLANPPVVVRETDSLFTILQNTAHFYRILGRDNVFLIKDILEAEEEIIEPTMADFYRWSLSAGQCGSDEQAIAMPLEGLYEYAGFFLNTLGGQSYLFRRAPRVRTLTKYYSVLVIDRANDKGLNTYGIDIRPVIETLIEEMEAMQNLASREEYLHNLQSLKIKYEAQFGG